MPGLAKLPTWLHPITPATIGILALVLLFVIKVIHEAIVHWAEDRRDKQQDRGE